mgnify:FL=1
MGFESHKIVKEYVAELTTITALKEDLVTQLQNVRERFSRAESDDQIRFLTSTAKDLKKQIEALELKGARYMRKIDELNGVR